MSGANVQQTVVEELRLGAEPAVTLHQLTGEQNVWEMLSKHSLATPTPVQVMALWWWYNMRIFMSIFYDHKIEKNA